MRLFTFHASSSSKKLLFMLFLLFFSGLLWAGGFAASHGQNSTPSLTGTYQDFDSPGNGTAYITATHVITPATFPVRLDGGPTGAGNYMQLVPLDLAPAQNSLAFDRSDLGSHEMVVADFDFRIIADGNSSADGFGMALLDTSAFGTSGAVPPQPPYFAAEEPNFEGSFGIGFDLWDNGPPLDSGENQISIHYDGELIQNVDATQVMNLAEGIWTHVRVILRPAGGYSDATVSLTPCGSPPVTVVNQLPIPDLVPYEGRVYFAARTGGESAAHEIDNVHVQFTDLSTSVFSFQTGCETVIETENEIALTVTRLGDISGTASVDFATSGVSATSSSDFSPTSGTLIFANGETTQSLTIPILDDTNDEGDEVFHLTLSNPVGNGIVGGPEIGKITIVDDEAHDEEGYWGEIIPIPIVPIHLHMLPTGQALLWDRGDTPFSFDLVPRLWDPQTGQITSVPLPESGEYDLFCSAHSFLADGRLLVTGGHIDDAIGEEEASIFDPFTGTWEFLPDMNAGRWYPSNVTLATGEILVIGGTYSAGLNRLPQVWQPDTGSWRNLTTAMQGNYPNYADYYPFLFQAGNGKVFYAGPQQTARYLDTSGTGAWSGTIPSSMSYREYGSAVMFDDGKVLMAGGSLRDIPIPFATAEVITLTDTTPTWEMTNPMNFARRNLNLTLLPDGTVLATGGSSAPGFNNSDGAPMNAELWDPDTGEWTLLAGATRFRGYHSTAILLPDGRVLTGGGGHPNPDTGPEYNFEIFYPPYLFKGPRPTIATAPNVVTYDQSFTVQTPNAGDIQKVTWIRLSSVTHAFNQNQRINHLPFTIDGNRLQIDTPTDPKLAPPGHYMLFILNGEGVPSIAHIIQILPEEDIVPPVASFTSSSPDALGATTTFTNTSSGTDLMFGWDFGDGVKSTDEEPTHTYASTGTFSVTLTITNALGVISTTSPVEILLPPIVGFTSSSPDALGITTTFTNTSSGTDLTFGWDFGDGLKSTEENPTHTYDDPGTFSVTLTITNALGVASTTAPVEILLPPTAGFTSSTPDALGTTTIFTNTSSGTNLSFGWDFGDGIKSTEENPTHTYNDPGTFSVTLTITNALGVASTTAPVEILLPPTAGFTSSSPDALGTTTIFTNTSTGSALSYLWDFGDGVTSTHQNPTHTYSAAGMFPVTLTIKNDVGASSTTLPVDILLLPTAGFISSEPDLLGETTFFTNTSTGLGLSYLWDFGDGAASTQQNPTHIYATTGNFAVTLTVANAVGSDTITLMVEIIAPPLEENRIFLPIVTRQIE